VKYLKFFNLSILVCLVLLFFLQGQYIYEYLVEEDIAWRTEIQFVIIIVAIGAIIIASPAIIICHQKKSKISNTLLGTCFLHFLIFVLFCAL